MKLSQLFLMLIIGCSACTSYQYAVVSSDLPGKPNQSIRFENDSLTIDYEFTGSEGQVQITVFNKLTTPLYIDWSKSALIVNKKRISYWNNDAVLNASVAGSTLNWNPDLSTSLSSVNGTIANKEAVSFIPPQSFVMEAPVRLQSKHFQIPAEASPTRKTINALTVKSYSFDKDSSPLSFRSFITISDSESFQNPRYFDHSFWVSEIIRTGAAPHNFPAQKDQFYIGKPTGVGAFLTVAAAAGLTIIFYQQATE
jgi:hypothetical protein